MNMNMNIKNFLIWMRVISVGVLVSVFPAVVLAADAVSNVANDASPTENGVTGLILLIGGWVKMVLPLIIAIAVVWFVWNVFQYTIAGDEEKKKEAKSGMIWGIVGIFVMVSVWGLVAVLQSTFGLNHTFGTQAGEAIQDLVKPF